MASRAGEASETNGAGRDQRSIAELTRAVSRDATALVRAELDLAKLEVADKMKQSAIGAGMAGAALVLAVAAVGTLTAAAVLALSLAVAAWLAALIVTIVLLVIAAVLARVGAAKLQAAAPPVPSRSAESAKEDLQWLKQRATSERR